MWSVQAANDGERRHSAFWMTTKRDIGEPRLVGGLLDLDHSNSRLKRDRAQQDPLDDDGSWGNAVVWRADASPHSPRSEDSIREQIMGGALEFAGE